MGIALRCHEEDVGVARIDDNGRNLFACGEARGLPRLTGVGGLVESVAFIHGTAGDLIAGADVNDVRVGRRHLDGADG